jgi:hypothetical protein
MPKRFAEASRQKAKPLQQRKLPKLRNFHRNTGLKVSSGLCCPPPLFRRYSPGAKKQNPLERAG